MKGLRSLECYRHQPEDESHSTKVNRGAQIIMTKTPDQLTAMFKRTVLTVVFIVALVSATYLLLELDSVTSKRRPDEYAATAPMTLASHHCALEPPTIVNVIDRELCSPGSDDPLRRTGSTNAAISKLMDLNISANDVHYVFTNHTYVPRLSACSLESAVRAVGNGSRVNVFVVHGIHFERHSHEEQHPSSLARSLCDLVGTYGDDRLKVRHVSLEECLECSPFQGTDLSTHPLLARFAVQLALLWQFGGTVLDAGVVAFRGQLYRANASSVGSDAPVEYGDRAVISSPVACHAFIYDTMVSVRDFVAVLRDESPFDRETVWEIVQQTVQRVGHKQARPVAKGIVCHDGSRVLDDRCYYLDANASNADPSRMHLVCPVMFGEQILRGSSP